VELRWTSLAELSSHYKLHPSVINKLKHKLLAEAEQIFEKENTGGEKKKRMIYYRMI
jgi:hypothetical protein